MAKLLLADENFPFPSVVLLKNIGHNVATLSDLGKAGQALSDPDVLSLATSLNRAVITFNRKDFIKLHNQNSNHQGIIVCKFDTDFKRLAFNVNKSIANVQTLKGQLIKVNRG